MATVIIFLVLVHLLIFIYIHLHLLFNFSQSLVVIFQMNALHSWYIVVTFLMLHVGMLTEHRV